MSLARWSLSGEKPVGFRILMAIMTVGGVTLVVRCASTLKELVVARLFGTGDALDAFLIAFVLPSFTINVVAGSFQAAFIPTYVHVRETEGLKAAKRLFQGVMMWGVLLLVVLSVVLALLSPYILPVLGSGFDPEKMKLTRSLFFFLLPVVVISGLATEWAADLNAAERFALAAWAPIMTPAVTIVFLVIVGRVWGIYALALGTVIGFVLQAGLLGWGLTRQNVSLVPQWYGMDPATKQIIRQYLPMVAGALLMCSTVLVDQAMAAMLGPGSVAALDYGNKLVAFGLGIGSMALGTAVLPHFSRMIAVDDWTTVKRTLKIYMVAIIVVTIPLTLLMVYFSKPLVRVVFQRGAFSVADTTVVSGVFALYAFQVPFYLLGILGVRLLSAMKKNQILMVICAVNLGTNIVGNYILIRYLGVAGISLSTSIVYALSMVLVFLSLRRELKRR